MSEETNKPVCGVVYVAIGEKFVREAEQSLESLRKTNPTIKAMLLTNLDISDPKLWDKLEVDPALNIQTQNKKSCRGKLQMDRAPWDRCLYIDSDTMVVGDLAPGFALLDRFEFLGEQIAGGHHYQIPGLPESFPEINGGILFWRPTDSVREFFNKWRELYDYYDQSDEAKTWDQKSLRIAMWQSDVRFGKMPATFNLMPYFPAAFEGKLVIAHGRDRKNLERLHRRVSKSTELRAYVPGIGVMEHPQKMSWGDVLYIMWRMLAWKVRGLMGR